MAPVYQPPSGDSNQTRSIIIGTCVCILLFLAIPLTQIFTQYEKAPESIDTLEIAPPPPPPPPEEPPPPPEPEEDEPPPELDAPPPPITLEQLDMALNPGTGGSLSGDFAMPSFNAKKEDLGTLDIFDIGDLDNKPRPRKQSPPKYPSTAKRRGQEGFVVAEFIIDEFGNVVNVVAKQSSDPVFEAPTIDAIRGWKFTAGEKDGRKVKTRTRVRIPYTLD